MDARAFLMPVEKGSPATFRVRCMEARLGVFAFLPSNGRNSRFSDFRATPTPSRQVLCVLREIWPLLVHPHVHPMPLSCTPSHSLAVVRCTYSVPCKHLT